MSRTLVYGPAYLDHVVRIDRPLIEGHTFDGSYDGRVGGGEGSPRICDERGRAIHLEGLRRTVVGPVSTITIPADFPATGEHFPRRVEVLAEAHDLGGMGAGFASAFGGELVSALGPAGEPVGDRVAELLAEHGIAHRPIRVPGTTADWTMIVTSGRYGDKLAIGFRGCHSAVERLELDRERSDLLVVAALPNPLLAQALGRDAAVKFLAPARRNMTAGDPPLASLAGEFDILSCNRAEWECARDRETILLKTPIVALTDGPNGCEVAFLGKDGRGSSWTLPAFPRDEPPRDTNRAGEAFAAALVSTLLEEGWRPGPSDPDLVRHAAFRGSAAAALVLDREAFGFPSPSEIEEAMAAGKVGGGAGGRAG